MERKERTPPAPMNCFFSRDENFSFAWERLIADFNKRRRCRGCERGMEEEGCGRESKRDAERQRHEG
ncbi:hypothetical protein CEXT_12231 [Caerostris extrusa]|uniref:Uncharacterized protein n=1 Tax=Caerostris extrusa TaxID=172846 RepID=A0AAV4SI04_CAEEX|nr:hypothetical protein CEXT_12231 [Caerostris extrusa]